MSPEPRWNPLRRLTEEERDKVREMIREVHALLNRLPHHPTSADLQGQAGRAASSVLLNSAEGFGRGTPRQYAHFLRIAYGSFLEVEAAVTIIHDLFGDTCPRRKYGKLHQSFRAVDAIFQKKLARPEDLLDGTQQPSPKKDRKTNPDRRPTDNVSSRPRKPKDCEPSF